MFHPVAGHRDQKGNRAIAVLFHDLRTRCGWVSNIAPAPFTYVLIEKETGWVPGSVWIGAENLAPPGSIPGTSSS